MVHDSLNRLYAKDDINKRSVTGINEEPVISLFVIFFYFPNFQLQEVNRTWKEWLTQDKALRYSRTT